MKINSDSRHTFSNIVLEFGSQRPSQRTFDELINCYHLMKLPAFVFYSPMSDMISVIQPEQASQVELDLSLIRSHPDTEPCDLDAFSMLPWLPAPHLEPGPMMFLCSGWLFLWTANPHTGRWGLKAVAKH